MSVLFKNSLFHKKSKTSVTKPIKCIITLLIFFPFSYTWSLDRNGKTVHADSNYYSEKAARLEREINELNSRITQKKSLLERLKQSCYGSDPCISQIDNLESSISLLQTTKQQKIDEKIKAEENKNLTSQHEEASQKVDEAMQDAAMAAKKKTNRQKKYLNLTAALNLGAAAALYKKCYSCSPSPCWMYCALGLAATNQAYENRQKARQLSGIEHDFSATGGVSGSNICQISPSVCSPSPDICQTNPGACGAPPDICQTNPGACGAPPDICQTNPGACGAPPDICQTNPGICNPGNPLAPPDDICQTDPNFCNPNENICQIDPNACTPQDDICQTDPNFCNPNENICQIDPNACTPPDDICQTNPDICNPNSEDCATNPTLPHCMSTHPCPDSMEGECTTVTQTCPTGTGQCTYTTQNDQGALTGNNPIIKSLDGKKNWKSPPKYTKKVDMNDPKIKKVMKEIEKKQAPLHKELAALDKEFDLPSSADSLSLNESPVMDSSGKFQKGKKGDAEALAGNIIGGEGEVGGSGIKRRKSPYKNLISQFRGRKKLKRDIVGEKSITFGDDKIGVIEDNIFLMVNRTYEEHRKANEFIETSIPKKKPFIKPSQNSL